ncbi:MAG: hypothetical protein A2284_01320 [Deltaproteobacteria bacterium RIFOXYA12_FULL_61_11]|nr:MAG: hypothetical protein A2284_01320 [Deltaproteobacteria bacterium RIFOXYA12_FULL_61_11]
MQRLRGRIKRYLEAQRKLPWLKAIPDPRKARGKRFPWWQVLQTLMAGLLCGKTNLRGMERLAERLGRRISDTQLSRLLGRIPKEQAVEVLRAQVHRAWRSKSLQTKGGFNQVAVDGKTTWVGKYEANAACHRQRCEGSVRWKVHVMNGTLVSSAHAMLIDQMAVPSKKGESSSFPSFFSRLLQAYGKTTMLQVLSADAGITNEANARLIDQQGIAYVLALKGNQPTLYLEAQRLLSGLTKPEAVSAWTSERQGYAQRQLFRSSEIAGFHDWNHLRQVILVRKVLVHQHTGEEEVEDRYFLTNLPTGGATAEHLLEMVRNHWMIENGPHWTLDTQWLEDDCPLNARAIETVGILRAIAYNILGLLRSKHLRSARNRARSWQGIMELVLGTLLLARSSPPRRPSQSSGERAAAAA